MEVPNSREYVAAIFENSGLTKVFGNISSSIKLVPYKAARA